MFLRVIDSNEDGIITAKEMKEFTPCDQYDSKRINRAFRDFGRKVDLNDLADELTPRISTLTLII